MTFRQKVRNSEFCVTRLPKLRVQPSSNIVNYKFQQNRFRTLRVGNLRIRNLRIRESRIRESLILIIRIRESRILIINIRESRIFILLTPFVYKNVPKPEFVIHDFDN